jgi:hypothetical protein
MMHKYYIYNVISHISKKMHIINYKWIAVVSRWRLEIKELDFKFSLLINHCTFNQKKCTLFFTYLIMCVFHIFVPIFKPLVFIKPTDSKIPNYTSNMWTRPNYPCYSFASAVLRCHLLSRILNPACVLNRGCVTTLEFCL